METINNPAAPGRLLLLVLVHEPRQSNSNPIAYFRVQDSSVTASYKYDSRSNCVSPKHIQSRKSYVTPSPTKTPYSQLFFHRLRCTSTRALYLYLYYAHEWLVSGDSSAGALLFWLNLSLVHIMMTSRCHTGNGVPLRCLPPVIHYRRRVTPHACYCQSGPTGTLQVFRYTVTGCLSPNHILSLYVPFSYSTSTGTFLSGWAMGPRYPCLTI